MPAASTALTTKVESGSPYQLDSAQVRKLPKHIQNSPEAQRMLIENSNIDTQSF